MQNENYKNQNLINENQNVYRDMNNVWQLPVDKPAQTVLKQNIWKWNISTLNLGDVNNK